MINPLLTVWNNYIYTYSLSQNVAVTNFPSTLNGHFLSVCYLDHHFISFFLSATSCCLLIVVVEGYCCT